MKKAVLFGIAFATRERTKKAFLDLARKRLKIKGKMAKGGQGHSTGVFVANGFIEEDAGEEPRVPGGRDHRSRQKQQAARMKPPSGAECCNPPVLAVKRRKTALVALFSHDFFCNNKYLQGQETGFQGRCGCSAAVRHSQISAGGKGNIGELWPIKSAKSLKYQ
jgi:hypothetical protein